MQGLDVGNCDIMLHVRVCNGLVRQLDGSIEKRFDRKELLYPIQVCSSHIVVDSTQACSHSFMSKSSRQCANTLSQCNTVVSDMSLLAL